MPPPGRAPRGSKSRPLVHRPPWRPFDYAEASFERSPILKQLIANRTADALELTNDITLEVRPASFRKLRGPTYVAVIADELAFWYVDAAYANPDVEILNAVEPGLATRPADPGLQSTRAPRRVVGRIPPPLRSGWRPTHSRGSRYEPVAQSVFATARGRSRTGEGPCPRDAEYLAQFRTDVEQETAALRNFDPAYDRNGSW
jgi:hypothetical protein